MRAAAVALLAAALAAPASAEQAGPILRLLDSLPAAGWGEGETLSWFDYVDMRLIEKMVGLPHRSPWPEAAQADEFTSILRKRLAIGSGPLNGWFYGTEDPLTAFGLSFGTVDRVVTLEANGRAYGLMAVDEGRIAADTLGPMVASFEPGILALAGEDRDYQALAGIAVGAALSLAGIPDVQAAIRAIERQLPEAGAIVQLHAVAAGPRGFVPIMPDQLPLDERDLPQPSLIVIADRQEALRAVGLLAMPYPDRATAEVARDIVAARASAWEPLPPFIRSKGTELPIEIVDTGPAGRAVLLVGLSRPGRVPLEEGGFDFWRRHLLAFVDYRLIAP